MCVIYLPVLRCRERIETEIPVMRSSNFFHLPVLRCRERIETCPVPRKMPAPYISLYFGAGSGLKLKVVCSWSGAYLYLPVLRCRERIETCEVWRNVKPLKRISLYFGAGSGLKQLWGSRSRADHRISLYFGAGSGLKHRQSIPFYLSGINLPVLRCRERIETWI